MSHSLDEARSLSDSLHKCFITLGRSLRLSFCFGTAISGLGCAIPWGGYRGSPMLFLARSSIVSLYHLPASTRSLATFPSWLLMTPPPTLIRTAARRYDTKLSHPAFSLLHLSFLVVEVIPLAIPLADAYTYTPPNLLSGYEHRTGDLLRSPCHGR